MSLEAYIKEYQLEKIFPTHYFDKLQVLQLSAGDAICHQGESLTALSLIHISEPTRLLSI